VVDGVIEWDLFKCPNPFKIYPNCKLKEEINSLENYKRDLNKKEFTVTFNITPDLFVQNAESGEDEDDQDRNAVKKYELDVVCWDEEQHCLVKDPLVNIRKHTKETIIFKTSVSSAHAIVVARNIDFPFKSFFIRNVGDAV